MNGFKTAEGSFVTPHSKSGHLVQRVSYEKTKEQDAEGNVDESGLASKDDIFLTAKIDEFGFIHPANSLLVYSFICFVGLI